MSTCHTCGEAVSPVVATAQRDAIDDASLGGPRCTNCLTAFETDSATKSLLNDIEDALSAPNAAAFKSLPIDERLGFALTQIKEGNISGGTPGYLNRLRAYLAVATAENVSLSTSSS
jgi:hypothetical protein